MAAEAQRWPWAGPSMVAALLLAGPARADDCRDRLDLMDPWMVSGRYSNLSSDDREGGALLGASCHAETITAWFAGHGWTLATDNRRTPDQFGPAGQEYWSDSDLNYCLPADGFWSWFGRDCDAMAHIIMFESRITHVSAGPTK